jgi:carbon-monoxide dehydrogenase medium subunit
MKFFEYSQPASLHEAVDLLEAGGGAVALMAGGTDLIVQMKEHVRGPERVLDIKRLPGLDDFRFDVNDGLTLGALVTVREVETSALAQRHYPSLARACTDFASIQVRNRATVVGNVCRASPSADTLPPLIADGARVVIAGPNGRRECPVEAFCTAPGRTRLESGEIVTHIVVPPPLPDTGKVYLKHGRRVQMELATVGVAVTLTLANSRCSDVRIVLAAVAPTPMRARKAEALLRDLPLTQAAVAAAAQAAADECTPITDVRASAAYRREMVRVLTRRAIEQAIEETQ